MYRESIDRLLKSQYQLVKNNKFVTINKLYYMPK